jgi:ABC-type siderophore export system fused ATPase/permease subunit
MSFVNFLLTESTAAKLQRIVFRGMFYNDSLAQPKARGITMIAVSGHDRDYDVAEYGRFVSSVGEARHL